jgi:ABC-type transporter Mla MlaB component
MLRITSHDAGSEYLIRLEGCLCEAWVPELAACWIAAAIAQRGRMVRVDLADVAHVDEAGRTLMALMHRAGVRFEATGLVMSDLVREIAEPVERDTRS